MFNKWLNNIFTNQKGESFTVLELVKKLDIEVKKVIAQVEENKVLTEETKLIVDAINLIVVDVENRMSGLETDMTDYKIIMGDMYDNYVTSMNTAFSTFKNETNADINTFKADTNDDIALFKSDTNTQIENFENTVNTTLYNNEITMEYYRDQLIAQMYNLQENMNALTVVSGVGSWKNTPNNFGEVFNDYINNTAKGQYAHAGGTNCHADGKANFVHGVNLNGSTQEGGATFGRFNTAFNQNLFTVGAGTNPQTGGSTKNAFWIDGAGNVNSFGNGVRQLFGAPRLHKLAQIEDFPMIAYGGLLEYTGNDVPFREVPFPAGINGHTGIMITMINGSQPRVVMKSFDMQGTSITLSNEENVSDTPYKWFIFLW